MTTNHKIDIGGELHAGDLIGVSYSNAICYGWYVPGRDSLMFVRTAVPARWKQLYEDHKAAQSQGKQLNGGYFERKFKRGLRFECLSRDFITTWHSNRVFKVEDPDAFFKGSNMEKEYLEARAILHDLKFPAR